MNENDMMARFRDNFPYWLEKQLRKRKLTQSKLSANTGISGRTISVYINWQGDPRMRNFFAICKALDYRPEVALWEVMNYEGTLEHR